MVNGKMVRVSEFFIEPPIFTMFQKTPLKIVRLTLQGSDRPAVGDVVRIGLYPNKTFRVVQVSSHYSMNTMEYTGTAFDLVLGVVEQKED